MSTHIQWHAGERAVHRLLNGEHYDCPSPSSAGLSNAYARRVAASPLVALGAIDRHGRPWTTVLGGQPHFAQPLAPNVLGVESAADLAYDPVVDALFGAGADAGADTDADAGGGRVFGDAESAPLLAALSINLETRDRVKMAGKMVAGAVTADPASQAHAGEVSLAMLVQEALGNCPKYLNRKAVRPHTPHPMLLYDSDASPQPRPPLRLPQAAVDVLQQADLFFLSSTDGHTMDTNHRGGPPGFLRVADNDAASPGPATLVYPEYSGNRLYQTLGNLHVNPLLGLVVPDFASGRVLYLTGHTKLLVGQDARACLPHTALAVAITVDRAILVADGLPFRGEPLDYSPYNPPVRPLLSEIPAAAAGGRVEASAVSASATEPIAAARLTGRQELTPSVARFTFALTPTHRTSSSSSSSGGSSGTQLVHWHPGQYIMLDFGPELDRGWSHMRDSDPQSLNDDFVRSFTISSPPPPNAGPLRLPVQTPVEAVLTLRRHGPATNLLWRHRLGRPLVLPVLAFGGDAAFRIPLPSSASQQESVFVAAGVGITPLLAQAPGLLSASGEGGRPLRVLWSLRSADVPLAVDSFRRTPGLAGCTTVFLTDAATASGPRNSGAQRLRGMGATVVEGRRITKDDVEPLSAGRRIYVCTGSAMLRDLQAWLPDADLVWESFAF